MGNTVEPRTLGYLARRLGDLIDALPTDRAAIKPAEPPNLWRG